VLIHVNANYMDISDLSFTSVNIMQNYINVITRVSVPAFVMLSGAFNLRTSEMLKNIGAFYRKAVYKIGIPYLCVYTLWGVLYNKIYCGRKLMDQYC
jgi:surface polysaccharide O-acyltransferase-like enzyme